MCHVISKTSVTDSYPPMSFAVKEFSAESDKLVPTASISLTQLISEVGDSYRR